MADKNSKAFYAYCEILEDDADISIGNLHACVLKKDPRSGWPLAERVFQVSFYDSDLDFEVSNVYDDVEDAVNVFLEIRDLTTIKNSSGCRFKASQSKYERILKYKPSAFGEIGKRRLQTRRK